ncbi:hypothetical protein [uncultured Ruegeria sp.]|uniref:tetratricopeptide repeat protein n=1 Tax=uncultured Ruegeria sp. TaxID=259304 RepID=UPI00262F9BBC|nr:hypothetical protein [uncultured Ruegeria sp.]
MNKTILNCYRCFLCSWLVGLSVLLHASELNAQNQRQEISLTREQARIASETAIKAGNPDLAIQIGNGLLLADSTDPQAYFVLAAAHLQRGDLRSGRRAARQAYQFADTSIQKFDAAQLAARIAFADNHYTTTQFWMRRAVQHAPTQEIEDQIAQEFKQVRSINPWSLNVGVSIRPSDNVNNGADTGLNTIDGVPITGILSPEARALSGIIGIAGLNLGYRLRRTNRSQTSLAGRLFVKRVRLSDEARSEVTRVSDGDFNSTYAETSITHDIAIGENGFGSGSVALGRFWSGGDPSYDFARLSLSRGWTFGEQTRFSLNGLIEDRSRIDPASEDAQIYGLGAKFTHDRTNGDSLSIALTFRDVNSINVNDDFATTSLQFAYSFNKPVGPAHIGTSVTLGYLDYSQYNVGFIEVPGGRQDNSVQADVTLSFRNIDYAGFIPTMRIKAGKSLSNVSRFDTREVSISFGVQSKF